MRRRAPHALAAALAASLWGCAVGPDYQRPELEVPASYRIGEPAAQALADTAWWDGFGDPVLSTLVREALANNLDLAMATARVDQFLGSLVTTRSAFFPQVDAIASASTNRVSRESGLTTIPGGADNRYDTYQAYLSASWELDLWGRIRRLSEAGRADVIASEEGRRGVVLSVATAAAGGYIQLRDFDRRLQIARDTAKLRGDSLELFRKRHAGGVISRIELAQVTSEYESALAVIPAYEQMVAQQENAIALLLGRNPGPIPRGKALEELVPVGVPAGLPSQLLERRPDIARAEQQLIAANASIGAAKALYFPTISLSGSFGSSSTSLSNLFRGDTTFWSVGAGLAAPVFNGGAIAGQVQRSEAGQREALASYIKTVRSAFGDVDNSLVAARKTGESAQALRRQVAALDDYVRLAQRRYENGYSSYLEVLDAQRTLFQAQLNYSQQLGSSLSSLVDVYKAMGGGWIALADPAQSGASAVPLSQRVERQPMY
jgi:multidrug efflux system outer membrane protein